LLLGLILPFVVVTAGCTIYTHPTSVEDLPGTDRMAKAPGLLVKDSPYATENGFVVYSSNPSQPSLVGPRPGETAETPAAGSGTAAPAGRAASAAPAVTPASPQTYQQFREFEEYQRFIRLPDDSPERVEFQQWLEWQNYRRWKSQHGQ